MEKATLTQQYALSPSHGTHKKATGSVPNYKSTARFGTSQIKNPTFKRLSTLWEERTEAYTNANARVSLDNIAAKLGHKDVCDNITPTEIAFEWGRFDFPKQNPPGQVQISYLAGVRVLTKPVLLPSLHPTHRETPSSRQRHWLSMAKCELPMGSLNIPMNSRPPHYPYWDIGCNKLGQLNPGFQGWVKYQQFWLDVAF
ncbi:hypothetical protein LguiB_016762 [Lonicera macranthoides]